MIKTFALLPALALLTVSGTVYAAPQWVVTPEQSHLTFSGLQGKDPFSGEFKKFTPNILFDKNDLKTSHIRVVIETGSATLEGVSGAENLPTTAWLNTSQFPEAVFESKEIIAKGNDTFEATGTLSIVGVTKDVTLPFSLKEIDGKTHATGTLAIKRLDFGIGKSVDPDGKTIADIVEIKFEVTAAIAPQ